jgi:hypothetical protein
MESHPIDLYSSAVEKLKQGDSAQAAKLLSKALGSDKVTGPIETSIEKMLTQDTLPHAVVLEIMESQVIRKRRGYGNR